MAHYVTCSICKKRFDRDKYPAVLTSSRRYAHALCAGVLSEKEKKKEEERIALETYIIKLFNLEHMDGKITLQIKRYLQEHPEYTYSGIRRSLEYFYEIKKNPIDKANGGIGIVPWIYEEAKRYYYNKWLLSQKNKEKDISAYVPKVREIVIQPPKREPIRRKRFTFLDQEEVEARGKQVH